VVVVLGDAQGGGTVVDDGEAPGTALRLVAGLVVHLSRDGECHHSDDNVPGILRLRN
jgi:hypothetical protein